MTTMSNVVRWPLAALTIIALAGCGVDGTEDGLDTEAPDVEAVVTQDGVQEFCIQLPRGGEICFGRPDDPTPTPVPDTPTPVPDTPTPVPDTPTPVPTPTPCPTTGQIWNTTIYVGLEAYTDSPIWPNIVGNFTVNEAGDVARVTCDETWTVALNGTAEVYGVPVTYELTGDGHLPNTDGPADLASDLTIKLGGQNCQFTIPGLMLSGNYLEADDSVAVAGQASIQGLFACGAYWDVAATLEMSGPLQ